MDSDPSCWLLLHLLKGHLIQGICTKKPDIKTGHLVLLLPCTHCCKLWKGDTFLPFLLGKHQEPGRKAAYSLPLSCQGEPSRWVQLHKEKTSFSTTQRLILKLWLQIMFSLDICKHAHFKQKITGQTSSYFRLWVAWSSKTQFYSMGQQLLQFPSLMSQIYSLPIQKKSQVYFFICGDCHGVMLSWI